jgi:hypothetical protein
MNQKITAHPARRLRFGGMPSSESGGQDCHSYILNLGNAAVTISDDAGAVVSLARRP